MNTANWTVADTQRALRVWEQYQQNHDVSERHGQAVGIDPVSERIWFGESLADIANQKETAKVDAPLLFLRVGRDYYQRKGSRG